MVVFTHLDKDHYSGASEFFYLEHAKKYQSEDRVQINMLWVPAAVINEEGPDENEARVIQAEARYRLVKGKGIRVFSRPDALKDWLKEHGLTVNERAHRITEAGQTVPEFTTSSSLRLPRPKASNSFCLFSFEKFLMPCCAASSSNCLRL